MDQDRFVSFCDADPTNPSCQQWDAAHTAGLSRMLRLAAIRGDVQSVQDLLARGANPNYLDRTDARDLPDSNPGKTALHYAAGHGREEVVAMLLENGADPNARRYHGDTPLMEWVRGCTGAMRETTGLEGRDYHRVAVLLLAAGADPHASRETAAGSAWMAALARGVLSRLTFAQAEIMAQRQADELGQCIPAPLLEKTKVPRL